MWEKKIRVTIIAAFYFMKRRLKRQSDTSGCSQIRKDQARKVLQLHDVLQQHTAPVHNLILEFTLYSFYFSNNSIL